MFSEESCQVGSIGPSQNSQDPPEDSLHSKIRVLLVDDHTMLRQGLKSIVNGCDHMEVVGDASNGLEAIGAVSLLKPDVVVMDVNMPTMNGIEATKRIKQMFPDTSIIGLSVQNGMDIVQKMQAAGIFSYLTKESAVETLCHAIEDAAWEKNSRSS